MVSRVLGWMPIVAGVFSLVGGTLAILGWSLNVPRFADWDGDKIAMQPNAGISAMLVGAAMIFVARGMRKTAVGFCLLAAALGAATLVQHALRIDLGIDRLLLFDRKWGMRATVTPGRMGVPAATSWTLVALAIVLAKWNDRTRAAVPGLGLAIMGITGMSLTGYVLGSETLFALPRFTAISAQTAAMLMVLGMGVMALAPDRLPTRLLTAGGITGALARWASPVVVILPVLLGFLCLKGHTAGFYDAPTGTALLVFSLIVTLCAMLWSGISILSLREESLRRSDERFALFMQQLPGLAWIKDEAGRYLFVNDQAVKAFGHPREKLYGRTDDEVFPAETASQFRQNDREAMLFGQGLQVIETLRHDDGLIHHSIVNKFPIATPDGASSLIAGIAIDITERKRAEETVRALLRVNTRLNSTLRVDTLLDILVQEAISLIGAEAGVAGLLGEKGMTSTKYFRQGKVLPLDYCWPPMHGLPGWLIVNKTPYRTNDAKSDKQIVHELCERFGVWSALSTPIITVQGAVIGFFEIHNKIDGTGFDNTDQEILTAVSQSAAIAVQNALAYQSLLEAEDALKRSDRKKDEFLAVLAHELRNPLAPIRTGLEIVRHAQGDAKHLNQAQETMERQVTHLVRLVDDLLDVSRIRRDKLELRKERVELSSVIRQALETSRPLAERAGLVIECRLPDRSLSENQASKSQEPDNQAVESAIYLHADPVRLAQVFGNLLNNACKFSRPGGKIVVSVQRDRDEAVVSVQDDGLGIPPEKLGQIFDMFTQAHQSFERSLGGLGIGLTLVRRLTEMHGGSVTAHSRGLGHGSEFVVRLPIDKRRQAASLPLKAKTNVAASRKILVVDDNRDAAETLGLLLRLNGHQTSLAFDGEHACSLAASYRPNVILLDIGLPKMNGYDVCRAIREQPWGSNLVIVALTGWGQEEDRRKSSEAGFNGHLVKPVTDEAIVKLLDELSPPTVKA